MSIVCSMEQLHDTTGKNTTMTVPPQIEARCVMLDAGLAECGLVIKSADDLKVTELLSLGLYLQDLPLSLEPSHMVVLSVPPLEGLPRCQVGKNSLIM